MKTEESKTDLGTVRIHNKVIASIAALAAMEVDGVKGVDKGLKLSLFEFFGKKLFGGIRVGIDKNEELKLEIPLVVKYGFNLPEIANKVQENVHQALEKMTNLAIKDININIQGIERS
jgi:uncharacterized alkaline shock family protein YloU